MARARYFTTRSITHARALLTMPAAERARYFAERAQVFKTKDEDAVTDPVLVRRGAVEDATMAAVSAYSPEAFEGHLDLMLPCAAWKHSADVPLRWSRLAASSDEFVGPDDCNGDTMLLPEHAATFAAFVAKAQQRHSRGGVT
jgi:hypothetical protein